MNVLSVVCARAGSKGLNNKCLRKIDRKMVVEYSIEYSNRLGSEIKTVVSTDIKELIVYCKENNIDFVDRNPEFCTDDSRIDDTLADVIEKHGRGIKYCSLVYGNIPTRYPDLFHSAANFLHAHEDYDAAISMQNVEKFHPAWMYNYNEETLPMVKETSYRRQMLPQKMIHDGHTLIFQCDKFLEKYKSGYENLYKYSIFGDKIKPVLSNSLIIDIDTEKDLKLAEAVIRSGL